MNVGRPNLPLRLRVVVSLGFVLVVLNLAPSSLRADDFQGATHLLDFERDPIRYSETPSQTAVDALSARMESETVGLEYTGSPGYLESVLEELGMSVDSQVLVFAKSSAQRDLISPRNPRALYFNDDVYVGYIPGAPLLELTASDPALGTVFYTLEQNQTVRPRFQRTSQCLECHAASRTMGVPGHLFRSFAVDQQGFVDFTALGDQITQRLSFAERFGGWYVSRGGSGWSHSGRTLPDGTEVNGTLPFDPDRYPRATSRLLPLLVLSHQVHFHNYLTRLNYEGQIAMEQYGHTRYLRQQIDGFLRYLLFVDEKPLPEPVNREGEFAEHFQRRAKRDEGGRSLRDFELTHHLFRFRCSYLVGSAAFAALEPNVQSTICRRLQGILEAKDPEAPFNHLAPAERTAIRSILLATEPNVVRWWRNDPKD